MPDEIDDSLYSRQRCVLGDNAMQKMSKSRVFLLGLGGVGIEIAKNLILAGIGEIVIQDYSFCTQEDLGTQFYVQESDVIAAKTRAQASLGQLSTLNPYVQITVASNDVTKIRCPLSDPENKNILKPLVDEDSSTRVDCLILTQCSIHQATLLNLFCRIHNIKFIYTDVYGVFGNLFCDFGSKFTVSIPDDEPAKELFIGQIEKLKSGELLVKMLNDHRHHLDDGDIIRFTELEKLPQLSGKEFSVKVKSPTELIITSGLQCDQFPYSLDGIAIQVKKPQEHTFKTMIEEIKDPRLTCVDWSEPEESKLLHLIYLTLTKFKLETGRYPKPWDDDDWKIFRDQMYTLQKLHLMNDVKIDESLAKRLSSASQGQLAPLCAVFGGIAAQEAMKAVTSTFTPFNQWLYLQCASIVPTEMDTKSVDFESLISSRYAALVKCIGTSHLRRIRNLSIFMVGCGAIGCELLKNLALLGVASAHPDDAYSLSDTDRHLQQQNQCQSRKRAISAKKCVASSDPEKNDNNNNHRSDVVISESVEVQCLHSSDNCSGTPKKVKDNLSNYTTISALIKPVDTAMKGEAEDQNTNDYPAEDEENSFHPSTTISISSFTSLADEVVKTNSISTFGNTINNHPNIIVTDPDHIEKSNLNRQFFFHSCHIGLSKSQVACDAVKRINSHISIHAMCNKFWPDTEKSVFTDEFLVKAINKSTLSNVQPSGVVLAALDCIATRRYLDSRCVTLHLPLFESGTLGTKGHVQVILPNLTESYNSQRDDHNDVNSGSNGSTESQLNSIPYCTLKSFPTQPVHCIEWAREKFASQFTLKPLKLKGFLQTWNIDQQENQTCHPIISDLTFLMDICKESVSGVTTTTTANSNNEIVTSRIYANDKVLMNKWIERINLLQDQLSPNVERFLCSRPSTWHRCLCIARDKFEYYFNHKARQLLHSFPIDTKLSDGTPFWQFPKRPPKPVEFSPADPLHQTFIISYARLLADQLSIEVPQSVFPFFSTSSTSSISSCSQNESFSMTSYLEEQLASHAPPVFTPSQKHIVIDENEIKPSTTTTTATSAINDSVMSARRIVFNNPCFTDSEMKPEIYLNEMFLRMCSDILEALSQSDKCKAVLNCRSINFEKDDDNLAHVDFITSAANLRAVMYSLQTTPRHTVKRIAGRIVPAIATTTATVSGLVCLELLKYILNTNTATTNNNIQSDSSTQCDTMPITTSSNIRTTAETTTTTTKTSDDCEKYLNQLQARNSFLNLALPILVFSQPGVCRYTRLPNGRSFSLWDHWCIDPWKSVDNYLLSDFIEQIKCEYNLVVSLITQGNRMIYMNYFPMHKSRLNKV
nr:unnamed protein product [Trichobilharzia regenti]